jgi:hypothetical protein
MAEQRIAICSAKRDNRVLGYIEGSEAFDLFGRRRADYNPNTGLLYDLLDGGVVGYVTFESKFAGLSRVADEMFPKTYEVTPQQSQEDYVSNLSIVGVPEAGEQRRAERIEPAGAVSETKSSPPPKTIEPAVEVSSSYTRQETIQQELISNSSGWIAADELVGHGGAEAVVSVSGVYEMPSLSEPEQGEVSAAAFSNAVHLSHLGSCQPELQSNVPSGSVADELSGRRGTEYDFSIRENYETPVSAPPLQDEPGATFFPQSHDGAYQETRPSEPCSNEPDLGVTGGRQGDAENELISSINQTPSPPLVEHDEAPARTPLSKAYDDSPDEGGESERPSSDSRALGVVETFMQCVAEYVHSIPNDTKETPSPPPSRQDEVANLDSIFDLRDTHREQLRGDGFGRSRRELRGT